MAAKLYKDLTPTEQKARDTELKDMARGAKFAPMDLLGAPVDLITMGMRGVGIPVPEKPFLGSEYLIDKYADLGEALDINYDRPTGSTSETAGRIIAGVAGIGGEAALLAPGIGKLFAKSTKTRGSGTEVKGSGNIEMEASPSDLGPPPSDGTTFFREESLAEKISEARNPKSRETITYMSPDEFLTLAEKGESPEKLAGVRELVDNDTKFSSLPSLRFTHDGKGMAKVEGHEGRHRMMVLKDAGVERVPVRFESSELGEGRGIRWGSQDPDSFDFVPPQERPTRITNQDGDAVLPMFDSDIYPVLNEAPTTVAPKKEVLEGEIVGTKSKKYTKLEKEMGEARTPELRSVRELNMEIQGVDDAFNTGNASINIDKSFEFVSGGDEARYTSDDFIDSVKDSYEFAREEGFSRGEALISAVRERVDDYNKIYPDALDLNSVLDDVSRNVNDDFGFDQALGRFREGQTNRKALEAELTTKKNKARFAELEAEKQQFRQSLGITDDTPPEEAQRIIMDYANKQQAGISGIGIPDPTPPKPNLRLVKKAAGGKVDMRSGIGDLFKVYS